MAPQPRSSEAFPQLSGGERVRHPLRGGDGAFGVRQADRSPGLGEEIRQLDMDICVKNAFADALQVEVEYMQINFISILEYIGIVSFAASGAYVAMGKRMDIFWRPCGGYGDSLGRWHTVGCYYGRGSPHLFPKLCEHPSGPDDSRRRHASRGQARTLLLIPFLTTLAWRCSPLTQG